MGVELGTRAVASFAPLCLIAAMVAAPEPVVRPSRYPAHRAWIGARSPATEARVRSLVEPLFSSRSAYDLICNTEHCSLTVFEPNDCRWYNPLNDILLGLESYAMLVGCDGAYFAFPPLR